MGAVVKKKRNKTAKQLAEETGLSVRSIYRLVAEPRDDYEERARFKRELVAKLRADNVPLAEIAQRMNITVNAVKSLHKQARRGAGA